MDRGDQSLPIHVNPASFPAKLWRLVNNPANQAISWDSVGERVLVHQQLFESQVLTPGRSPPSDSDDAFKTTSFSSFVRQLNLYGFRKTERAVTGGCGGGATVHSFYNKNFQRQSPELVSNLRRLTVENKAKLRAGEEVVCRTRGSRDGRKQRVQKRVAAALSLTCQVSAHPDYPHTAQAQTSHCGTTVEGGEDGAAPAAVTEPTDSLLSDLLASYCAEPQQQPSIHHANCATPHFTSDHMVQHPYQSGFSYQFMQYYVPNVVTSQMAGCGSQIGPLSSCSYYQELQSDKNQETYGDIDLNTIFQLADELLQTQPGMALSPLTSQVTGDALLQIAEC